MTDTNERMTDEQIVKHLKHEAMATVNPVRMQVYGDAAVRITQLRTALAAANERLHNAERIIGQIFNTEHMQMAKNQTFKMLTSERDTLRSENAAMREALDKADACLDSLTGLLDSDIEDRELARVRAGEYSRASHYARLTTQEGSEG